MSTKQKETIQDRLKVLKNARAKSILENRRIVYDEAAGNKESLSQKIKLQELKDEPEKNKMTSIEIQESETPVNISSLEYTVEEDEQWETKKNQIQSHLASEDPEKGELHNYKKLAERTYAKNVRELEKRGTKTKEEYQVEKLLYEKLKSKGMSSENILSCISSDKKLDKYVSNLKNWEENVSRKRRKITDEGKDGAIHEKNRQFNSKLERHYRKFRS